MKQFLLIRHAKTEEGLNKKDMERNLVEKGIQKMKTYTDLIKNKIENLEAAFVSPANRTQQTARILLKYNAETRIFLEDSLYTFNQSYLSFIQNLPSQWNFIALVGHNHSLEYTLNLLLQTPSTKPVRVKTSCIACFCSTVNQWQMVTPQNTFLEWILNG
ncbi:MAG: histidine phosphatase family protein [Bacteroidia bacterium]|nr:histidine phosphatase family protein [Bacteroidia bacterium]MDW8347844.1 histidine phosphatase family protein [Bacteroidia bacterium]